MVARGRVQNGVVVLADGVRLPEGQEVTVLAPPPAGPPAHSILDIPAVSLGAVVRPFSSLHGATRVAAGARIGPLTTLIDTEVGESATVVHSYAQGASIGAP